MLHVHIVEIYFNNFKNEAKTLIANLNNEEIVLFSEAMKNLYSFSEKELKAKGLDSDV